MLAAVVENVNKTIGALAKEFRFSISELEKFGPVQLDYWVERFNELQK